MATAFKKKSKELGKKCGCGKVLENFNSTQGSREHGLCSYCFCGSDIANHPDAENDITQELA